MMMKDKKLFVDHILVNQNVKNSASIAIFFAKILIPSASNRSWKREMEQILQHIQKDCLERIQDPGHKSGEKSCFVGNLPPPKLLRAFNHALRWVMQKFLSEHISILTQNHVEMLAKLIHKGSELQGEIISSFQPITLQTKMKWMASMNVWVHPRKRQHHIFPWKIEKK